MNPSDFLRLNLVGIEEIYWGLNSKNFGDEEAEYVKFALKSSKTVQELNLSNNVLQRQGISQIMETLLFHPSLMKLSLNSNQFGDEGALEIAGILPTLPILESLEISNCGIGLTGGIAISSCLFTNASLISLDISMNYIRDDGGRCFANSLKTNQTLKRLNLRGCGIERVGIQSLLSSVQENCSLDFLEVADNEGYSPEIQCQLDSLLQSEEILKRKLKTISIFDEETGTLSLPSTWMVSNEMIEKFIDWETLSSQIVFANFRSCGLLTIPSALYRCKKLQGVDFTGNPLQGMVRGMSNEEIFLLIQKISKERRCSCRNVGNSVKKQLCENEFCCSERNGVAVQSSELKLIVVGEPAVGKTTLIKRLQGEAGSSLESTKSTDGIDLGVLEVEDLTFVIWDFGGQDLYKYTHQLFLSGHSICLVLYDLLTPEEKACKDLDFWLTSISRRGEDSSCLLVGTHCGSIQEGVATERRQRVWEKMKRKHGGFLCGFAVIDSVRNINIDLLLASLVKVGKRERLTVPALMEDTRIALKSMACNLNPPVASLRRIMNALSLIPDPKVILHCLEMLHTIGSICLIKSTEFCNDLSEFWREIGEESDEVDEKSFGEEEEEDWSAVVVLEPQWLSRLLTTVVTFRHSFVKEGILSVSDLHMLWRGSFSEQLFSPMMKLLVQLDIVFPLSSETLLVPCLLPERSPALLPAVSLEEGEGQWRLYLMKEKQIFPVGLMGKLHGLALSLGRCTQAWRGGCVVECSDGTVICLRRKFEEEGVLGRRKLIEDEEGQIERDGVHLIVQYGSVGRGVVDGLKLFRRLDRCLGTLFSEFYHVDFETVVPVNKSCTDWCTMKDIQWALKQKTPQVTSRSGMVCRRVDELCPDINVVDLVRIIPQQLLKFEEIIGEGGFGVVSRGQLFDHDGKLEEIVAIKEINNRKGKIFLSRKGKKQKGQEELHFTNLDLIRSEIYLMSAIEHPNVVNLRGVCLDPVCLIMELVEGGELWSQLSDSLGLIQRIRCFERVFQDEYTKNLSRDDCGCGKESCAYDRMVYGVCEGEGKRVVGVVGKEIVRILQTSEGEDLARYPEIREHVLFLVDAARAHWRDRNMNSFQRFSEAKEECLSLYEKIVTKLDLISLALVFRISIDVAAGLQYLHSLCPPVLHRDLKSLNIFLAKPLFPKISDLEAAKQPIAKIGDFGLSVFLESNLRSQEGCGQIGTINPRWVAPEILSGHLYCTPSDIYSLGLLMWEIKYQKLAYSNPDALVEENMIQNMVCRGERPPIDKTNPFDQLCSRCWATNPAKRPTSTEVLRTLCSLAQTEFPDLEWNLPSLPRDPPSSETTTERKQRQRIPCQTIHLPKFDPLTADKPPSWFKVTLKNSGNLSLILKTLPVMRTAISQDHKVSCSAIFRNYLWLGSQNGGLAVLDTDDGEISLASDYLFAEGRSSFRAMTFSVVNHIVWTGNERGLIQAWKGAPVSGSMEAENLFFEKGSLEICKGDYPFRKFQPVSVQLFCAGLHWKGDNFHNSLMISSLASVKVKTLFLELKKRDPEETIIFRGDSVSLVYEWAHRISHCIEYLRSERVIGLVDQRPLSDPLNGGIFPIISMTSLEGKAWSLDGLWRVMEWDVRSDETGMKKGNKSVIEVLRQIKLDITEIPLPVVPTTLLGVGKQLWSAVGKFWILIEISSFGRTLNQGPIICLDEVNPRVVVTASELVISKIEEVGEGEREEKGERREVWTAFDNGNLSVWDVESGECIREWIWTDRGERGERGGGEEQVGNECVRDHWESVHQWPWDCPFVEIKDGEKIGKAMPEKTMVEENPKIRRNYWSWSDKPDLITELTAIGDQVWCATKTGTVFLISSVTKEVVPRSLCQNVHESVISGIHPSSLDESVWTSSLDCTLVRWSQSHTNFSHSPSLYPTDHFSGSSWPSPLISPPASPPASPPHVSPPSPHSRSPSPPFPFPFSQAFFSLLSSLNPLDKD